MKPTQEQEPVAWRFRVKADNAMYQKNKWHLRPHRVIDPNAEVQPLYTAPPVEPLKRLAALAYEAGRKDENEACAQIAAYLLKMPENDISAMIRRRIEQ